MESNIKNQEVEIVRGELNIERLPEIFNRQAYKGGVRVISRRNQKLEIGVDGMTVGFGHHEYTALLEINQMWEDIGRPISGAIYNGDEKLSLSEFTDNLYGENRKFRTGKSYRRRVERWLKNLLRIPMVQTIYKRQADGTVKVEMQSFTFLSSAEGILSKNGRYFDLSKIVIHPVIVKSLLAHHMKPVRLDVIRKFKGDNEVLFYRELDLRLSRRLELSLPLIPFCNDLGITYKQARNYTDKAKRICKKLINKPLSSGGVIDMCFIETKNYEAFITARKGDAPRESRVEIKKAPSVIPTKEEISFEARRKFLFDHYSQFSQTEKEKVGEIQNKILGNSSYKTSELTIESCFYDAIESVLKQEFTKEHMYQNIERQPLLCRDAIPIRRIELIIRTLYPQWEIPQIPFRSRIEIALIP